MKKMQAIYVAGPYRSGTREGVQMNINSAMQVGKYCCQKGYSPIIPHLNTGNMDFCLPDLGDQYWLDATMELLRRCDAVVLCPGWQYSEGTKLEIAEAERLKIPVFLTEYELPFAYDFAKNIEFHINKQYPKTVGELVA